MYKAMAQIEKEYDGHWVFMINCTKDEYHSIAGGEVVLHSESRGKVFRHIKDAKTKSLTFFGYVGKAPEGVAHL